MRPFCVLYTSIISLTMAALPQSGMAADFAAQLGYGRWVQDYRGFIDSTNSDLGRVQINDDLAYDSENAESYYLLLEHPLGVVPNVRVQYSELETDSFSTLSRDITYEGVTFNAEQEIFSAMDLSHTDISLYWQPLQGRFDLGVGITVRIIDGSFQIRSTSTDSFARQSFDEAFPLPYLQARYTFGDSGITLAADLHGAAYDGDQFIDSNLRVAWESSYGLGVEAGYRRIKLEIDDLDVDDSDGNPDIIDTDLQVDGLFIGVFYAF